jgi:hypothetical protein
MSIEDLENQLQNSLSLQEEVEEVEYPGETLCDTDEDIEETSCREEEYRAQYRDYEQDDYKVNEYKCKVKKNIAEFSTFKFSDLLSFNKYEQLLEEIPKMTIPDLKKLCDEFGVLYFTDYIKSKSKKDDIVEYLTKFIKHNMNLIKNKENIFSVSGDQALQILNKLNLKQFTYKKNQYDDEKSYKIKQLDIDYGFIAEEVSENIPSLAVYDFTELGKQKIKSEDFTYNDLNNPEYVKPAQWKNGAVLALLVGAVQNLNEKIENLESQLAAQ